MSQTLRNHAMLYKRYNEVISGYGKLASVLSRKFLIQEANTLGYSNAVARKIINKILKDPDYKRRIEEIILLENEQNHRHIFNVSGESEAFG